jgi:hypothetical protein
MHRPKTQVSWQATAENSSFLTCISWKLKFPYRQRLKTQVSWQASAENWSFLTCNGWKLKFPDRQRLKTQVSWQATAENSSFLTCIGWKLKFPDMHRLKTQVSWQAKVFQLDRIALSLLRNVSNSHLSIHHNHGKLKIFTNATFITSYLA